MDTERQKTTATRHETHITTGQRLAWIGTALMLLALGAHFYRAGNIPFVICTLGFLLLHASRALWAHYVVGFFLAWGVMEWGQTAQGLIAMRMQLGAPWLRGVMILSVVAACTALASAHMLTKAHSRDRERPGNPARTQAAAFILTFAGLYALRHAAVPGLFLLERLFPFWGGGTQLFLLSCYAALVAGKLSSPRSARKTRKAVWVFFSCVFFAQIAIGLIAEHPALAAENPHLPFPGLIVFGPVYRGGLGMMPFLALTAVVLTGSAWCSMLCYFGPLDSLAAGKKPVKTPPPFLIPLLRYGRLTVLLLGLAVAAALRYSGASPGYTITAATLFSVVSLIALLFFSRRYTGMLHCTTICPMGLVINVLSRISPWRIRLDAGRCTDCGACEAVCLYRAIDGKARATGGASYRCSLCRDCVAACPHDALSLRNPLLPPRAAGPVFTVLVVFLHVLFLTAVRP
ncbi:4Fe-4S ferredoxin [Desulfovibrio sp. OttesenSCG-928-I05]|nr:4Fe-4S ferredoxin [Desulfovibrio sp. OttesenSCG-928-I05]